MAMRVDDVVVGILLAMLVAAFSVWTGWRVLIAVHRQRRMEMVWRERLAVWSLGTRLPGEPPSP
jgi:hypothetical protein